MTALEVVMPEAALRHCRTVTRRRARNFYYGLKLLPEPKRSALYAIYAWMREADDITDDLDDGPTDRAGRLAAFRRRTDDALAGRPDPDDPLWPALGYASAQYDLTPGLFHDLLAGQLDDVEHRDYASFDDLLVYCRRVASTVGLLCIEVWGYDGPDARALAADRGVAFQLTNIIRDFAQDHDLGRVYLPTVEFEAADLTPGILREWSEPARCRAFMIRQIERARDYYEKTAGLDALVHEDCRPTLWAMTSIYRGLLEKAREDPARVILGRRLRLSSLAKAGIALRARMMSRGEVGNGRT